MTEGNIVKFKELTQSLLRNGCVNCSGVEMWTLNDSEVIIQMITSKGKHATGYMSIPREALSEFISMLENINEELGQIKR